MQKYIFNRKYLSSQLQNYTIDKLEVKHKVIKNWNYSLAKSDLEKTKEESIQGDFLTQIFSNILGYKGRIGEDIWNLQPENKTDVDGTKSDGSLGFFTSTIKDVRIVIELKNAKTDLDRKQNRINNTQSPVEQAFSYQFKHKSCKWVIVSNFKEIRLYHSSTMTEYEVFFMNDLAEDIELFKKFCFLLEKERLIDRDGKSQIDLLYEKNEQEEIAITKDFYKDYKTVRSQLYKHINLNNPAVDDLIVFEKTQKILDRFIFVCFCEDTNLLPKDTFKQVIISAKNSFDISETRIWNQLKGLFYSIDKGNPPLYQSI
ncbi:type IIL restriction-modification enzyme MmeI [Bacillus toyonensis]|uniref:type IIL restriction-modification enzyme MmeI n=1 Tax=Bacillus toyonensis TaxID=155322 RepID=UPI000C01B459|nr:type IIL restriction-modification enzyme MmeI [Bacillus toyonensis]PGB02051.1 hypothetical protein COL93_13580 [Bacillus toyonensis]